MSNLVSVLLALEGRGRAEKNEGTRTRSHHSTFSLRPPSLESFLDTELTPFFSSIEQTSACSPASLPSSLSEEWPSELDWDPRLFSCSSGPPSSTALSPAGPGPPTDGRSSWEDLISLEVRSSPVFRSLRSESARVRSLTRRVLLPPSSHRSNSTGTPVHISSGTASLAIALYLGKRRGYGTER